MSPTIDRLAPIVTSLLYNPRGHFQDFSQRILMLRGFVTALPEYNVNSIAAKIPVVKYSKIGAEQLKPFCQ